MVSALCGNGLLASWERCGSTTVGVQFENELSAEPEPKRENIIAEFANLLNSIRGTYILSWKGRFVKNFGTLGKDLTSEMMLEGDLTFLLKQETLVDAKEIKSLLSINDPITNALGFYLRWKTKPKNFSNIRKFFSSLNLAIKQYAKYKNLSTRLLEILIDKRIQFNMCDDLECDLLSFKVFVDDVLKYKLVLFQDRILTTFTNAIIFLAKKGKTNKTGPIVTEIISKCEQLEKTYRASSRFDLERGFIKLRLHLAKIFKNAQIETMRLRIAISYEDEGDFYEKKGAGMGITSYAKAFMDYLDLGEKTRLENVKKKLKNSSKASKATLKPVPLGTFRVSTKLWMQSIIPSIKYYDVLKSLTQLSPLYPSLKQPKDEEMGLAFHLMPFVVIDDDDNVGAILEFNEEPEECRKFRAFQFLRIEEASYSFMRLHLFKYLMENGLLLKKDIYKLISSSSIEPKLKDRLMFGVRKHFSSDFVSSSYFLTLQLEPLLVNIARKKCGLIAISHKKRRGATQETTLGTLLEYKELKMILGKIFYDFLQLYFVYDLGFNFRNEIAHGLINHKELSEQYSLTALLIVCKLLFLLE